MKTLCLLSMMAFSSLSAIENNAYFYPEPLDLHGTRFCLKYNGHYYFISRPEHFERCPCQTDTSCHKTP